MTVRQIYTGIDLEWISEQAEIKSYWAGVHKFLTDKLDSDVVSLSSKQVAWLERIEDDCNKMES